MSKEIVEKVENQVTLAEKVVANLQVTNQEEYDEATLVGKNVSKLIKFIDGKEKEITKPLNEALKNARALFKPYKTQAEEMKMAIKDKMKTYLDAEAEKKRIEEERIAKRVEKGTMREDTAVAKLTEAEETATDTTGTTSKVLVVNVVDIKAIPAEYLTVNESAIKKAYREGVEVPGVECKYEQSIRL